LESAKAAQNLSKDIIERRQVAHLTLEPSRPEPSQSFFLSGDSPARFPRLAVDEQA
jgi:hypothetical protein